MKNYKNWPIRKKLLLSMTAFSVIPIIIVTVVAIFITYGTMRDQLIYNYSMSSVWLQDRLEQRLKEFTSSFYEFEVNRDIKADIMDWYSTGQDPNYEVQWRLISALNAVISMDSTINSIDFYVLNQGKVLVAERSGARLEETGARLDGWYSRPPDAQTNLVFWRDGKELLVAHQITRFEDKAPMALIVMHLRPYEMQRILSDIKSTPDESIFILGDEDLLLEADYGTQVSFAESDIQAMTQTLSSTVSRKTLYEGNFWFYQPVSGGKLQLLITVPNSHLVFALWTTFLSGLIAAIIAAVLSIICSALYSQVISRPIAELSKQMRTFTLKDKALALPAARTDEIGVLQESFSAMVTRNQELIATEFQAKIEKRNAQLRALQAQINPHFMYNTLQVIGGMALRRDAAEVYSMTVALSDIMRYSLNFSKEMVPLAEEMKYLQSYLAIQNQRFDQRIELQVNLSEKALNCNILKLILQPLIENSFEHGLVEKQGEWRIEIAGECTEDGDLILSVSDNGLGIPAQRLQQIQEELAHDAERALGTSSHIGLCNVDSRIRIRYPGGNYGVTIESSPEKGTTVWVHMRAEFEEAHHDS